MKHLVDLKKPFINAHGVPYENEESSAGFILVDLLGGMVKCSGVEKVDAYRLCIAIRNKENFDMEESDIKLCHKAIDGADGLPANVHSQLLEILNGVEIKESIIDSDPELPPAEIAEQLSKVAPTV